MTLGLIAALGGCGGGSKDESPTDRLTDYLPAGSRATTLVDFEGVKQQLGLPADEPLPTYDRLNVDISLQRNRTAAADLYDAAAVTVAPLYDPATSDVVALGGDRRRDALSRALDTGAITAAAANERRSDEAVTVVRTRQPFDELADSLAGGDYVRDGDTLTAVALQGTSLTNAGGGVIVFATHGASTGDLAASPPGGPAPQSAIVDRAKDVVAAAGEGPARGCVVAFGGWHDADGGEGTLRLSLDRPAETARLMPGAIALNGGLELGTPTADGDAIEIGYRLEQPENSVSPVDDLIEGAPLRRLYDCG